MHYLENIAVHAHAICMCGCVMSERLAVAPVSSKQGRCLLMAGFSSKQGRCLLMAPVLSKQGCFLLASFMCVICYTPFVLLSH